MKKILSFLVVLMLSATSGLVYAYDFSAVASTGQTLYYNIVGGEAQVTSENILIPYYSTYPTGSLTIPSSVTNNGTTYSVTSIGYRAFASCTGLTSVTIPNSIISIGLEAFYSCTSLTSVTIPSSVTMIVGAFGGCTSLTSVTIPNSVTVIGAFAFEDCTSLTSVTIPNSVTVIGTHAFYGCTSLTSITIPDSVTSIGQRAFGGCNLDTVFMMPTEAPSLGHGAFTISGIVFVLNGCSYDNYYNDSSWISFRDFLRDPIINITLDLQVNDTTLGFTSIIPGPRNGNIRCDSTTVIEAIDLYGYFSHWSTGSTANPDTLHLVEDSMVTAYFIGLTIATSDSNCGTAAHLKIGDRMEKIIATANYGYHFDHWSNGSTANPDTINLIGDSSITAFFTPNQYTLTAVSVDETIGTVSGGGIYDYRDTVTVTAIAIDHHHLVRWSDDNRDNPRQVVMECDTAFTAFFAIDTHTVSVSTNDITRGMVQSSGTEFVYGTPCTVTATAYTGYTFAGWSNGVNANPYTFAVISDVELTALFVAEGEEVYTVTVVSADPTMGTASGGGQALDGGTVTIRAAGNPGYHFLRWNDNSTDSIRTVEVHGNVTYTAYFEANVGIDEVDEITAKIYTINGQIVVDGAERNTVWLYDVNGRILATKQDEYSPLHFDVPATGAYLVKIGDHPARKVVVIK